MLRRWDLQEEAGGLGLAATVGSVFAYASWHKYWSNKVQDSRPVRCQRSPGPFLADAHFVFWPPNAPWAWALLSYAVTGGAAALSIGAGFAVAAGAGCGGGSADSRWFNRKSCSGSSARYRLYI